MKNIRIISRLDIKGPNVVKGIHLEGLRVLGNPKDFAKFYYEEGIDELMYMDVVASLYDRNSLKDIIESTADELFVPLTVGGGLRNLEDVNTALRSGADKVCINTAAIKNPNLIKQISDKYGASTLVVAVEAIKDESGEYYAFTDNGREQSGKKVIEWVKEIQDLGAGEILLTSVDKEGTGSGFDIELIKLVENLISIPLLAHGGAGKMEDIKNVIEQTSIDAVVLSSILHYSTIKSNDFSNKKDLSEGNNDFLKSGGIFSKINPIPLSSLRQYLTNNNINIRNE
jgi:cyclase|tara:strand:+ start:565 stop:1419 length:855 start_codon:yes stop_codon:yes gene_type:complete